LGYCNLPEPGLLDGDWPKKIELDRSLLLRRSKYVKVCRQLERPYQHFPTVTTRRTQRPVSPPEVQVDPTGGSWILGVKLAPRSEVGP
jgi:hypothetical protein